VTQCLNTVFNKRKRNPAASAPGSVFHNKRRRAICFRLCQIFVTVVRFAAQSDKHAPDPIVRVSVETLFRKSEASPQSAPPVASATSASVRARSIA
jgi:hypothetical protein